MVGPYLLRPLLPDDIPALTRLLERAVPDDYMLPMVSQWIRRQLPLGAWLENELVAVVRLEDLDEGEGWCGGLRVAPEMRRQGLGRMLMEYLVTVARTRGLRVLRDLIEEDNTASRQLARSIGFSEKLVACHLGGTLTGSERKSSATPATTLPEVETLSWVRALGGYMTTTGPERFRIARASKGRLMKEMEWGSLFCAEEGKGCFLLSKPVKISWANRTVRSFVPLNGRLEDLIDAAASLMQGEGSQVDGFLPVDEGALRFAESRGWKPGERWGRRIVMYERDLL
jgi:GNAT superfamily N-acetyltransferase